MESLPTSIADRLTKMIMIGATESALEIIRNNANWDATTLLKTAIEWKNNAVVCALLGENGQKKVNPSNIPNYYPLHEAITSKLEPATIELLITRGCGPNRENSKNDTPLVAAVRSCASCIDTKGRQERLQVIDILIAHGAVDSVRTPVTMISVDYGNLECLKALIGRGYSLTGQYDEVGLYRHSILHRCAMNNSVCCLSYLLTTGFEADSSFPTVDDPTDFSYESPLSYAATFESVDCAAVLLEQGCDVDSVNSLGITPLGDLVRMFTGDAPEEALEILRLLEEQGADFKGIEVAMLTKLVESSPMRGYYLYVYALASESTPDA